MSKKVAALVASLASVAVMLVSVAPAGAANFEPGAGTYFVDTSALTLTGPGTNVNGVEQGGVAVFSFDNVSIPASVEIEVEGSRPFKLVAAGDLALAGLIEGSGFDIVGNFQAGPVLGGPGGGSGGTNGSVPGGGPGGGGASGDHSGGGGGGGFGGTGATGGGSPAGAGGAAYGDLNATLQGGSGGAGGSTVSSTVGGGGGGGAIALFGSSVRVTASGEVFVDGGSGAAGGNGASGGGSGGGIQIRGNTVQMDGLLSAVGGDGGKGGCCGAGGGGGGGRIALQYKTLSVSGLMDVSGGVSGLRDTTGCCSTGLIEQPVGGDGVVTKTQIVEPLVVPPLPVVAPKVNCVVPKLKGKKAAAARQALIKAHCKAGKVKKSFSGKVKKSRVIGQNVKPGTVLPEGAQVPLKVSKGEK